MRALTIHGPWAWAIAAGHKTVENRSWTTNYRGTLAIHAGIRHGAGPGRPIPGQDAGGREAHEPGSRRGGESRPAPSTGTVPGRGSAGPQPMRCSRTG